MEVVSAHVADAAEMASVQVGSWQVAYRGLLPPDYLNSLDVARRRDQWLQAVADRETDVIVARQDGVVEGIAAYGPCRDADATPSTVELYAMYVAAHAYGRGIGRQLWQEILRRKPPEDGHAISLWVLAANQSARAFYTAMGFEPEGGEKTVTIGGTRLHTVRYIWRGRPEPI